MADYDIIVIGAGISGLSLAHLCASEGLNVLVIEKNGEVGGAFHSHHFGGDAEGFWVELGAHTCYNSYAGLIRIVEDCGLSDRMVRRQKVPFRMLSGGAVVSIPSQIEFVELFCSAPRIFTMQKEGKSVGQYYSRIVGSKNYERVFSAAFNAVISQEAGEFPADMLFKKRQRRKDVLKSFTFTEGLQLIPHTLVSRKGIRVLTGHEVLSVGFRNDSFSVTTSMGEIFSSRYLAAAAPVQAAAALLEPAFPKVAQGLRRIGSVRIESLGVAVRKDSVVLRPFAGLIAARDSFYSVVSRDTVPHDSYRGFTFHFRPGVLDFKGKIARICEVLLVRRNQLEGVTMKDNVLPALRVGHAGLIAEVDRQLAGTPLLLTGNYFGGVAIEDCVTRSLSEYQRLKSAPR